MTQENCIIAVREGTSDEQIVHEVFNQDCYDLSKWKPKRYPKLIVSVV